MASSDRGPLCEVKVHRLHPAAVISGADGYSMLLCTLQEETVPPNGSLVVDTGLAVEISAGYVGHILASVQLTDEGLLDVHASLIAPSNLTELKITLMNHRDDQLLIEARIPIAVFFIEKAEPFEIVWDDQGGKV